MNANLVIMMGRLTGDVQLSYTPSNTAVASFNLANNRNYTPKGGQKQEKVCFIECVAFSKTGENIDKYFSKGDPIFVSGELTFDQWTAQDGTKRSKHKINVRSFEFISGKKEGGSPAQSDPFPPVDDDIPF